MRATGYSIGRPAAAYHGESAFRQEAWLAVVLLPAAFWLGRSWVEVALLAGSVLLVLIVELLNSGIEAAIDRVSFELHDLSKRAKDLAQRGRVPVAAAVRGHLVRRALAVASRMTASPRSRSASTAARAPARSPAIAAAARGGRHADRRSAAGSSSTAAAAPA